jgi:hypothetical protein
MLIALFMAMVFSIHAEIIYVIQGSNGDGTTWENAFGNLNDAIQKANFGDQIWVTKGTYVPTTTNDRKISFQIKDGIEVYGGFIGSETVLTERKTSENLTILSGEIGKPGIADNSYNVIFTKNVSPSTIVDGFIIISGNANDGGAEGQKHRSGGAWFNDGSYGSSKPTISNCIFKKNYGRDGAAMYNLGIAGEASPTLTNCIFEENQAGIDGGAMYNNGKDGGISNPTLKNCSFIRNVGTYGGAICNASDNGACNLYLENCSFIENNALLRGGAVFDMNGQNSCYLELLDCVFEGNYPDNRSKVTTHKSSLLDKYSINRP